MIPIDVKKIAVVVGLCLLVTSIVLWYCFGSGRVPDHGSGADQVEQIFNQLSVSNQALLNDLELSQQDLTTARQKLVSYQHELELLQTQLLTLKAESAKARNELEQANNSLKKANESLRKYEQEVQAEIRSLTWQRNGLLVLGLILAVR